MRNRRRVARPAPLLPAAATVYLGSARAGVTLLEVMVSILIMAVGMVSLLTLFPLGALEMARAAKSDRGAAHGRAAFRESQIRGLLDPAMWLDANANPVLDWAGALGPPGANIAGPLPDYAPPYAIDPLAIGYAAATGLVIPGNFPMNNLTTYPAPIIKRLTVNHAPELKRVLVPTPPAPTPAPIPYPLADRIFRSADDLTFHRPDNPEFKPTQVYLRDGGGVPVRTASAGDFSWLLTVSPAFAEMYGGAGILGNASTTRMYTVSVAVFFQRDLNLAAPPAGDNPASERLVLADLAGAGLAGGDVYLRVENPPDTEKRLTIRPNDWLLLIGVLNDGVNFRVIQWYRAATVDDGSDPDGRRITLAGPDFDAARFVDQDTTSPAALPNTTTVHALLFSGCVAVYEKTIVLDGLSPWTGP